MDLWKKAKVLAEEAAKRAEEAAKRSQELTKGAAKFSQEFVSETAKKSRELAAEASKAADQIKTEALRRADQIKTLASEIPIPVDALTATASGSFISREPSLDIERFGITDELKEFVKGLTINTFRDFPMEGMLLLPGIFEFSFLSSIVLLFGISRRCRHWEYCNFLPRSS